MSKRPQLRGRAARLARLLPGGPSQAARTPFMLLVVLLLGGGLITLLLLNSSLNEGSFQLSKVKRETQELTDEEQQLQREVDGYAAPDALQRRARELGMVPGGDPAFLNPDGTVRGVPNSAPGPSALRESAARPPAPLPPAPQAPEALPTPGAVPSPAPSPAAVPPAGGTSPGAPPPSAKPAPTTSGR
ncbi:septum formation initiator family protein [Streptomyces sp. AN091965]|uniref:septum formation initiator family protein n=1 Tax=Streptomyces sp. AN091965 TaxID=2927803 RepID=UPI001F600B7C|nr:septum formation initiator family protein [Streptomyces sp. AN091965]MCI3930061.1 septum formation initiator family protein [Streptomyces sp. AN091965]